MNLVDFDMLYGHRRDVAGYAAAATEFDRFLADFLPGDAGGRPADDHRRPRLRPLLHQDHRPYPRVCAVSGLRQGREARCGFGTRLCFGTIAQTVCEYLGVDASSLDGHSVLQEILK